MNYNELFTRNIGIISEEDQQKLKNSCVAIAGVGGVGGSQLINLARAGVGKFIISDPGIYDAPDSNRQYGAKQSTLGENKTIVMNAIVKDINPYCQTEIYPEGINTNNIQQFVKNSDVVIDAVEYFSIEEKISLYETARKCNKFVFSSPIFAFGTSLLVFDPKGLTFEEYFKLDRNSKKLDSSLFFPVPSTYIDKEAYKDTLNQKRPFPSFSTSAALSGAILATEVVLYLTQKKKTVTIPEILQVDMVNRQFEIIDMSKTN